METGRVIGRHRGRGPDAPVSPEVESRFATGGSYAKVVRKARLVPGIPLVRADKLRLRLRRERDNPEVGTRLNSLARTSVIPAFEREPHSVQAWEPGV